MRAGLLAPLTAPATRSFLLEATDEDHYCHHVMCTPWPNATRPSTSSPSFASTLTPGTHRFARTRGSPPCLLCDTYLLPMPHVHVLRRPHVLETHSLCRLLVYRHTVAPYLRGWALLCTDKSFYDK